MKKTQILNSKDELDKKIEEDFAKLDAILKEKNIKVKKTVVSNEEMKSVDKKIESMNK